MTLAVAVARMILLISLASHPTEQRRRCSQRGNLCPHLTAIDCADCGQKAPRRSCIIDYWGDHQSCYEIWKDCHDASLLPGFVVCSKYAYYCADFQPEGCHVDNKKSNSILTPVRKDPGSPDTQVINGPSVTKSKSQTTLQHSLRTTKSTPEIISQTHKIEMNFRRTEMLLLKIGIPVVVGVTLLIAIVYSICGRRKSQKKSQPSQNGAEWYEKAELDQKVELGQLLH